MYLICLLFDKIRGINIYVFEVVGRRSELTRTFSQWNAY